MSGRVKKLMGNTLIFAIGSFSSKAMVLLMMPLYTRVLTDVQYGVADLIATTSNLLMPFIMLSINEAIVRFGMDKSCKKREVFTIGISTVCTGFLFFVLLAPIMLKIKMISQHTLLIYLYVLAAALKNVTAQFVRSVGLVRLFAFDGFLSTFTTVGLNILFLVVFKWGSNGYILSIVVSNCLSVLFLFVLARLHRLLEFGSINKKLRAQMLRYSIPLVPVTMFWWITSASDRYVITYFLGEAANGIYAAAHKLPAMLTLVSAVFYQAWQISAISEAGQGKQTEKFYNQVYASYSTLLFVAASGLIMVCQPITAVWLSKAFYDSWQYVPFLTIAEVFSTLITFLGTFYMVTKKNGTVVVAIGLGAAINLGLNFVLVPRYGALGAAFATVISYLIAYGIRSLDVLRFVRLDLRVIPILFSMLLLVVQSWLLLKSNLPYPLLMQLGMFFVMILCNIASVLRLALGLLAKIRR